MRAVNIGSLNIDYVYDVEHFVTKGQTIPSVKREVFPGGKGLNQSIALSRAGADVCHAGIVGREGVFLREFLSDSGVDVSLVRQTDDCPSGHAVIQRDAEGDNCIILFGGSNKVLSQGYIDEVLDCFSKGDLLLLQNEINHLDYIIRSAKSRGLRIALNPSPVNDELLFASLDKVNYLILNEGEASLVSGRSGTPRQLLEAMCNRYPNADIVLTAGEKGSMFSHAGSETIVQRAYRVPVADTTAAGDTFTGYYLAEVMSGSSSERALEVASVAAAIAVSKEGAAPSIPSRAEVESQLREIEADDESADF